VPLGVYNISHNLHPALQAQAQILTVLSLITWAQCMYYNAVSISLHLAIKARADAIEMVVSEDHDCGHLHRSYISRDRSRISLRYQSTSPLCLPILELMILAIPLSKPLMAFYPNRNPLSHPPSFRCPSTLFRYLQNPYSPRNQFSLRRY
jgi:hypothetical protein